MAAWTSGDGHDKEEDVLHRKWSKFNTTGGGEDHFYPQSPPQKKRSRKCIGLCVTVVLLIILVCAIAIGVTAKVKKDNDKSDSGNDARTTDDALRSLSRACQNTLYPKLCYESLSNMTNNASNALDFVKYSLTAGIATVTRELEAAQRLNIQNSTLNGTTDLQGAASDCISFLQDSLDYLNDTVTDMKALSVSELNTHLADLRTWMSAALTEQDSCLDGIYDLNSTSSPVVEFLQQANVSAMLLSNALAFVTTIQDLAADLPSLPGNRRLLTALDESHVTFLQRRLLQSTTSKPNSVVAQDGSGDYRRITDAIKNAMQEKTDKETQYVIHIKAGMYVENVLVQKQLANLVFVGDGVGKTIISGEKSVIGSGVTTSQSATLTVQAKNFVGRDFTVRNTAGAANHQAVALRVTGDMSAFERCQFEGYQDTLYVHTNRQFYVNCTIRGTVDFIFGNAAVVFQSCTILADTGLVGQQNTYTASGRVDPNQNTGISFQHCTFDGTPSLKRATSGTFRTFLGRPWKMNARTVVMQSTLNSVLDPEGWLKWNDQEPPSTVYYAEYMNTGAGSSTSRRVSWSHQITQASEARKYTVDSFVQGASWLPQSNLTYQTSL